MIISEVGYNQVIQRLRFDAEFYLLNRVCFEGKNSRLQFTTLGELLIKVIRDPMGYGYDYIKKGIPYYRVDDLYNPFLGDNRTVFISLENHNRLQKTMLKNGDIIMAVRGSTIGRLGLYWGNDNGGNISPNVIILRPKNKDLSAYIAVYLLSKVGKSQIDRITAGTGQPTITVPYIKEIKIPIPPPSFQQKIELLVKESYNKRKEADEKYKSAEALLNKTLETEKLELKDERIFETRFGEFEISQRFDTDYYLPKFTEITRILKKSKFELKRFREVCKDIVRPINPLKRPEEKFTYVEIGDVDVSTGEIDTKCIFGYEAPPNARRLLKKGDLVISLVRPTRGAISIIPDELDNSLGSTAFYIISVSSPLREFLFVYLRSFLGINQLGRPVVGAMYPTLKKQYVDEIMVPIIPEEKQKQISDLIKQSFSLRREAKELLEKAKKEVERFIEKNSNYNRH